MKNKLSNLIIIDIMKEIRIMEMRQGKTTLYVLPTLKDVKEFIEKRNVTNQLKILIDS